MGVVGAILPHLLPLLPYFTSASRSEQDKYQQSTRIMFIWLIFLVIFVRSIHGFQSLLPKAPVKWSKLLSRTSRLVMVDPDAPPEVDPTRKDPDDYPPRSPIRLPLVDVGGTKMDVNSRLLQDRIIMIGKPINDEMANVVVAQLLCLAHEDPTKDITMYLNSPGGSISSGLAIFDAMQYIPCDVSTICFGTAASMGAFLLAAGTKGKRKSLPNARIMIHQPLGGARGQAADIEIQAKEILFARAQINAYLSSFTEQSIEKIEEDCDRDFFMTPDLAREYGLIDEVISTKTSHIALPSMPTTL